MKARTTSLELRLRRLSLKWIAIAFGACVVLGGSFFFYFTLKSSELRIKTLSSSVTRAFRPRILEGHFRDVQDQIPYVLGLEKSESAFIRAPDLSLIYSPDGLAHPVGCIKAERVCWDFKKGTMTYLHPIYFNEGRRDSLFGYLELEIGIYFDKDLAGMMVLLLLVIFAALAFGLSSSQQQMVLLVKKGAELLTVTLQDSLQGKASRGKDAPFTELNGLASVVDSMNDEIKRLRDEASKQGRSQAQLAVLRGVSHDLKTPFSQLRKFYETLAVRSGRTGSFDLEMHEQVKRSIDKVGALLKQVGEANRLAHVDDPKGDLTDILAEAKLFVHDMRSDPDFERRGISLEVESDDSSCLAWIQSVKFYRLLGNLVGNSLDFVAESSGRIVVCLETSQGGSTLTVSDNGTGIRSDNISRIFDADFTTKPSRGTGLGLSIVRTICEDVDASISVESNPGVGTTFHIKFPPVAQAMKEQESIETVRIEL